MEWDEQRQQRRPIRDVDSEAGGTVDLPEGRGEGRSLRGGEEGSAGSLERGGSADRAAGIHAGEAGSGAVQDRSGTAVFDFRVFGSDLSNAFAQVGNAITNIRPITITWNAASTVLPQGEYTISSGGGYARVNTTWSAPPPQHPRRTKCCCGEPKNTRWEHGDLECTWLESGTTTLR